MALVSRGGYDHKGDAEMMLRALVFVGLLTSSLLQAAANCPGHGSPGSMLVSVEWLQTHAKDPGLVVVGVGPRAEFDKGHIPGSVSLELAAISAKGAALTLELPPMAELADTFAVLGVSNSSRVVLYSVANSVQSATRVFLTLDAMGLGKNTALLDGGLAAWTGAGRPTTTEVSAVRRGTVEPCPRTDIIVDAAYVSGNLRRAGIDIVDARLPAFYTGEQIPNNQRAGHVPGAVNLPFSSMFDGKGLLKSTDELKGMLSAAGVKTGDRIVSYCHIGQQATVVYFVAQYLGFDARLYDGSWQDWSARSELPTEVSKKP